MEDIQEVIRINGLLDQYQSLLTKRQQTIMNDYYRDDLSLAEIADRLDISRNAVHDHIRRSIKILNNFEEKLKLYYKARKRRSIYQALKESIEQNNQEEILDWLHQLEDLD